MLYILKTLFFIKKNKPDIIIDNWGYSSLYNLFYHKIKIIGILHWTCLAFIKKVKYPNIVDKIKHFLYFWIMSLFEKNKREIRKLTQRIQDFGWIMRSFRSRTEKICKK